MCEDNWVQREDGWYYYGPGGMKSYGWLLRWDGWYYLDTETGRMMNGAQKSADRNIFSRTVERCMKTTGTGTGSEWYYYQQGGMKAKGWVLLADGWYYLDPESGVMARGVQTIGGQEYRFQCKRTYV